MTMFDIVVSSIMAIAIIVSMMRGLVHEVISLLIWIVSFIAAKNFAVPFAQYALTSVQPYAFSVVLGFILVFFAAWLMQHFLRSVLTTAISALGLGIFNRLLGALFGAVKGTLIITLIVIVCAFTDLPKSSDWQHSISAAYFEKIALYTVPYLPSFIGDKVQYPTI